MYRNVQFETLVFQTKSESNINSDKKCKVFEISISGIKKQSLALPYIQALIAIFNAIDYFCIFNRNNLKAYSLSFNDHIQNWSWMFCKQTIFLWIWAGYRVSGLKHWRIRKVQNEGCIRNGCVKPLLCYLLSKRKIWESGIVYAQRCRMYSGYGVSKHNAILFKSTLDERDKCKL